MCEHGQTVNCRVLIPANLSHTGEERWGIKPVDSCLVDLVESLNAGGVYTAACCCGHGNGPGKIVLHDGRILIIKAEDDE